MREMEYKRKVDKRLIPTCNIMGVSPVIVKELDYSNLRLIYEDEQGKRILSVEPSVLQYPSLNEVNYIYLDFYTANS